LKRALIFATLATASCTFFSGVEELEVRNAAPSSPAEAGATSDAETPRLLGSGSGGGKRDASADAPPGTGATCGAAGSWTTCEVANTFATCAERCKARGLACVESCCAYDQQGDFPAKVGMVYAVPGMTCGMASIPSNSSWGLCSDPVLPLTQGVMDVRCCCR
jgi:hypothetical protein